MQNVKDNFCFKIQENVGKCLGSWPNLFKSKKNQYNKVNPRKKMMLREDDLPANQAEFYAHIW